MSNNLYNPSNYNKEELINRFVVRLREYQKIMQDIRTSEMKHPEQPYIIYGLRGMGKTTLLLRLKYEIENDPLLNKWLIPVYFGEELYGVNSLSDLWEKIGDYLDHYFNHKTSMFKAIQKIAGDADFEKEAFNILCYGLQSEKKKIILLYDNIGELFLDRLSDKESHRLREILITSKDLRLIGASALMLEDTFNYAKPFYDFFNTVFLDSLSKEETYDLLKQLNDLNTENKIDLKKAIPQIETLRILSGGVIRTIILLYDILLKDLSGSALKHLEEVLDRITPLYKHRMDSLPIQQQKIMDVVAKNWDAISAGEIAEKIKVNGKKQSSKLISAQLQQLEKYRLIEKKNTNTKNNLYQVKERFFNIWYLMRTGNRYDRNRVIWLTKWIEAWFENRDTDLKLFVDNHLKNITSKEYYPKSAYYMAEALSHHKSLDYQTQHELLEKTKFVLSADLKTELSPSNLEIIEKVDFFCKEKDYNSALLSILKIEHPTDWVLNKTGILLNDLKNYKEAEKYFLMAIEKEDAAAMNNLAFLYVSEFKDFAKAEKYYLMAIEKEHAVAMWNLAQLYRTEFKDFAKAEKYYLMAIEKENSNAMNNLALLYETEFKDFAKAEKYYLMAIEKEDADAMYNLALLYVSEFKDFAKAEKYYLMAIEKEDADAMHNLALLYDSEFKDFAKAEKYYLMAIEKEDADAMYNLALLYVSEFKDFAKAEKYYLMAIEKEHAAAMNNLAMFYQTEFKDFAKAEKFYLMAIEKEQADAINNLAMFYQTEFKDFAKAEKFYLMAIEKENAAAMYNLALLYQTEFKDFAKAEKYYLMAIEKEQAYAMHNLLLLYAKNPNILTKSDRNLFDELESLFISKANDNNTLEQFSKPLELICLILLAKNQYYSVLKLFDENKQNLKDKWKPLYYATLSFIKEDKLQEYLRMGSELSEPVNAVLKSVKDVEEFLQKTSLA